MSEPNLKEMTQEELLKYLEQDFMPRVLDKLAENARLKAEVERLTAEVSYDNRVQLHIDKLATEFTQEQVERLTKAGDELHIFLISYIVEGRISSSYLNELDDNWNAAKEGKGQS